MPNVDRRPVACPQCGRSAHYSYTNDTEALRQSPLCWGPTEEDCPGYRRWKTGLDQGLDAMGAKK